MSPGNRPAPGRTNARRHGGAIAQERAGFACHCTGNKDQRKPATADETPQPEAVAACNSATKLLDQVD